MMKLNNNGGTLSDKEEEKALRKKEAVTSLYRYSDLSIENIAQQVGMSTIEVQQITNELAKSEALQSFVEKSTTKIEKIMSHNVASLDISKTAAHAAALMSEKKVGSVIVTKNGRPFGIVTERDLIRRYYRDMLLESLAFFAEKLKLHARTEEVLYPAAILIGEYLKLRL
jgi:signal-transduction protein with cAMP-binding, CBS, and nucleotidyltransferase domain